MELLDDPQVEANGYIGPVVIDDEPAYRLPAVPVQFDEQSGSSNTPRLKCWE
jgi:hypothetical protein